MAKKKDLVRIVVDTNIVFSGILNSSGKIGKLLLHSKAHFQFYTCDFLKVELLKHRTKLLKLTKLEVDELTELENLVTANISFINESLIPTKFLTDAEILLHDIDLNDTPFVALSKHLKARLWTGDMILYNGLLEKGEKNIVLTSDLSKQLDKLERD
jgi:predicted nucleic acid-binding protein